MMRAIVSTKLLTASLFVIALAACSRDKNAVKAPDQDVPWAPAKLTSVLGIPATEIEAALKRRLEGEAPPKIDEDQWGHTKRLYRTYGGNALWLDPNGFHGNRVYALANAVL